MGTRKSFIIHKDSLSVLDELTNDQAGLLFKAIKSYQLNEDLEFDILTKVAFASFLSQFERDDFKYQSIVERNKNNGSKGGRPAQPKTTQVNPNKPNGLNGNPKEPKQPDSKSDSKSDSKKTKALSSKLDEINVLLLSIFNYWLQIMGKTNHTKFTPQRKAKIKARLKSGYTQHDIETAIYNCANNPFNMGQNEEGKVFDDLTLICRDDTKLEYYMTLKTINKGQIKISQHQRDIDGFLNS